MASDEGGRQSQTLSAAMVGQAAARFRSRGRRRASQVGFDNNKQHKLLEDLGIDKKQRLSIHRKILDESKQGYMSNMPVSETASLLSNIVSPVNEGPVPGIEGEEEEEAKLRSRMEAEIDKRYHVERLSLQIYKIFADKNLPNFMKDMEFDRDGGLDRIEDIWLSEKYFWSAFLFVCIAFNVGSILMTNWLIFQSVAQWMSEQRDLTKLQVDSFEDKVNSETAQSSNDDIFMRIEDPSTRGQLLVSASIVGFIEVSYILYQFLWIIIRCIRLCCIGEDVESQFWAFRALTKLCHDQLPNLSTFSAIKLMAKVHPGLIMGDFAKAHLESRWKYHKFCIPLITAYFVVERILCMTLAVIAFAVKMCTVCFKLIDPTRAAIRKWLFVVALLNQCMGVVLLQEVLEKRVFLFIFGGPDSDYQEDERALEIVYRCRVASKIYHDIWKKGKKAKAFAMLTTFDHFDVQALLIKDKDAEAHTPQKADRSSTPRHSA